MGCCGQNRTKITSGTMSLTRPAPEAKPSAGVLLEYTGAGNIVVRGPATGKAYAFTSGAAVQVDRRDSDALRRTQLFR
jgi:hypothetical protein